MLLLCLHQGYTPKLHRARSNRAAHQKIHSIQLCSIYKWAGSFCKAAYLLLIVGSVVKRCAQSNGAAHLQLHSVQLGSLYKCAETFCKVAQLLLLLTLHEEMWYFLHAHFAVK